MEVHLSTRDLSISSTPEEYSEKEAGESRVPTVAFSDSRYDQATLLEGTNFTEWSQTSIQHALEVLDERSRDIINKRWLKNSKAKLKDLATHYNLSIERIRQLEKKAIATLRIALSGSSDDHAMAE